MKAIFVALFFVASFIVTISPRHSVAETPTIACETKITSNEIGAQIYLNGEYVGLTPHRLPCHSEDQVVLVRSQSGEEFVRTLAGADRRRLSDRWLNVRFSAVSAFEAIMSGASAPSSSGAINEERILQELVEIRVLLQEIVQQGGGPFRRMEPRLNPSAASPPPVPKALPKAQLELPPNVEVAVEPEGRTAPEIEVVGAPEVTPVSEIEVVSGPEPVREVASDPDVSLNPEVIAVPEAVENSEVLNGTLAALTPEPLADAAKQSSAFLEGPYLQLHSLDIENNMEVNREIVQRDLRDYSVLLSGRDVRTCISKGKLDLDWARILVGPFESMEVAQEAARVIGGTSFASMNPGCARPVEVSYGSN